MRVCGPASVLAFFYFEGRPRRRVPRAVCRTPRDAACERGRGPWLTQAHARTRPLDRLLTHPHVCTPARPPCPNARTPARQDSLDLVGRGVRMETISIPVVSAARNQLGPVTSSIRTRTQGRRAWRNLTHAWASLDGGTERVGQPTCPHARTHARTHTHRAHCLEGRRHHSF